MNLLECFSCINGALTLDARNWELIKRSLQLLCPCSYITELQCYIIGCSIIGPSDDACRVRFRPCRDHRQLLRNCELDVGVTYEQ
jgi:hypothetical protein